MNTRVQPFDNATVRQATPYAAARHSILHPLGFGLGRPGPCPTAARAIADEARAGRKRPP